MKVHEQIGVIEKAPAGARTEAQRQRLEELQYRRHCELLDLVLPVDITDLATVREARFLLESPNPLDRPMFPDATVSAGVLLWARLVARFLNGWIPEIASLHQEDVANIPLATLMRFLRTGGLPEPNEAIWQVPYYIWDLYAGCLTHPPDIPAAVAEVEAAAVAHRLIDIERHVLP